MATGALRTFVLLLTWCAVAGAGAQHPGLDTGTEVYRLTDAASYQEGCFGTCLCPLSSPVPVRGTFALGPPSIGDVVDFRAVRDIHWTVGPVGMPVHTITGSGTYRVTNFALPRQHALELSLSIDGADPQFFFSDFQAVDVNDGSIDLRVSMNGMVCFDIVIRVAARPVPADQIVPYRLVRGSSYQVGCFDPCDCVLHEPVPMRGRFGLVKLLDYGTYAEFAMVRVRFAIGTGLVDARPLARTGFGRYTLIQGFAGPAHEMHLTLRSGPGDALRFDSGLHNTLPIFPAIDIAVDMNDQVCFDTVLRIRARPLRPVGLLPMLEATPSRER